MAQRGFSLIELMIAIAVAGILMGISTLAFNRMTVNSQIDSQTKKMCADLMQARSQALYEKRGRTVLITPALFRLYSSPDSSVQPQEGKKLAMQVRPDTLRVDFDQWGGITLNGDGSVEKAAVCVERSNSAGVDSVVISRSEIQMGKLNASECNSDNVQIR